MSTVAAESKNIAETVAAFNAEKIAAQASQSQTVENSVIEPSKTQPVTIIPPPTIPTFKARVYMKASADAVEYLRLIVPKELRELVAKPALWRSLKTTDRNEALETAAVVTVAFQDALQQLADNAELKCSIGLSIEIEADNFLNLIETANKEDIASVKDDLIKSFAAAPRQRKTSEAKPKTKTQEAPADPSASKRLAAFKRKRKQRTKNGRVNHRRN